MHPKALLMAGLAAAFLISPASGAAYGTTVSVPLNTDGAVAGGPSCSSSSTIAVGVTPQSATLSDTYSVAGLNLFEFSTVPFEVYWQPDTCGLAGGSLLLTNFETRAYDPDTAFFIATLGTSETEALPAAMSSGVINEDTLGFHSEGDGAIIATSMPSLTATTSALTISETLGTSSAGIPDLIYSTQATISVLTDN